MFSTSLPLYRTTCAQTPLQDKWGYFPLLYQNPRNTTKKEKKIIKDEWFDSYWTDMNLDSCLNLLYQTAACNFMLHCHFTSIIEHLVVC